MLYVTLKSDHLLVTCEGDGVALEVRTKSDFYNKFVPLWEKYGTLQSSSSLDFPEDYTSDSNLILMCDIIRGNNVSGRNPDFKEQAGL